MSETNDGEFLKTLLEIKDEVGAVRTDVAVLKETEKQHHEYAISKIENIEADLGTLKKDVGEMKLANAMTAGKKSIFEGLRKYWLIPVCIALLMAVLVTPLGTMLSKAIWGDALNKPATQVTDTVKK